jgi:glycosyltransferase involved in cell wall biosynthesis
MGLKILMVLENNFPPDERVEKEIATLQDLGAKVSIACFAMGGSSSGDESIGDLMIFRKPISKLMHNTHVGCLKFPMYFNWWRKFLLDILSRDDFDALHIHDLPLTQVGIEMREKFGLKLVVDTHENWPASVKYARHTNTPLGKFLSPYKLWVEYEKRFLPQADAVITVVKEMKERVIIQGVPRDKVLVIQNVIDISRFKKKQKVTNVSKGGPIIYYGGGINVHRGVQIAIKALPAILEEIPDARLWVVGGGSYLSDCENLARELNVYENIYFSGRVTQDVLWDKLLESDICLIPHLKFEQTDCSSPNKIYQYMWAGKPIVTSNCDSLKRIVEETKTGVSYVHDDFESLAQTIVKLLHDKESYSNFASNGPKTIEEGMNWQKEAADVLKEIYEL